MFSLFCFTLVSCRISFAKLHLGIEMFRTEGIFQDISSSLLILYPGNKPTKGVCPPKLVVELGIATSGSQEGDKWHSRFVTLGVLSPVIFSPAG